MEESALLRRDDKLMWTRPEWIVLAVLEVLTLILVVYIAVEMP